MLEFKNVGFSYTTKKKTYEVYKDVNLAVKDHEFFCVIGPSGCGKSTLLKNVAGFIKPAVGKIIDDGKEISHISHERAMVFQEDAVFPWLTVYKNVTYGMKVRKVKDEIIRENAEKYIDLVGLSESKHLYPKELSGGMRKRVDLARVLANDPKLILMDEPFGALDAFTKEVLQEKVTQIWEQAKKTIIFVTHDIEEALFLGDRVMVMQHIKNGGGHKCYDIDFPRPRHLSLKANRDFQEMRRELGIQLTMHEMK